MRMASLYEKFSICETTSVNIDLVWAPSIDVTNTESASPRPAVVLALSAQNKVCWVISRPIWSISLSCDQTVSRSSLKVVKNFKYIRSF